MFFDDVTMNVHVRLESTSDEIIKIQRQEVEIKAAPALAGLKPVAFLKAWLGKQSRTRSGNPRVWIWERPEWIATASTLLGVYFSVPVTVSRTQALSALKEFRGLIGLDCPFPIGTPVLAYQSNEPGISRGYDSKQPGRIMVELSDGKLKSIWIDNLEYYTNKLSIHHCNRKELMCYPDQFCSCACDIFL